MPRNWMTILVELVGGRDADCDPPPGRTMLVGPRHSFADLAEAIDAAFARWDLNHLHMFELADGRRISDPDPDWDGVVDEQTLQVSEEVRPGDRSIHVFDLGDDWTHACQVEADDVDPVEVYGQTPRHPVPIWGWGSIPDQYGRRWAEDTGEGEGPRDQERISLTDWLYGGAGRPDRSR